MSTTDTYQHIKHFVRLARRGKHPGASGGERRAAKLAEAVLEYVPGMDCSAVAGLHEFIAGCAASYSAARELIEDGRNGRAPLAARARLIFRRRQRDAGGPIEVKGSK